MEAVKQGSACVGLKSKTHALLVALKVHVINVCLKDFCTRTHRIVEFSCSRLGISRVGYLKKKYVTEYHSLTFTATRGSNGPKSV